MDIKLPQFLQQELWKNYLIKIYRKYWNKLQKNLIFQIKSSGFIVEELGKMSEQLWYNMGKILDYDDNLAIAPKKIEEDRDILKRRQDEATEKYKSQSQEKRKNEYSEFIGIIRVLEKLKENLENLKIKIIYQPNGKLDFFDIENKIILKTNDEKNNQGSYI